jgi:hypothetical protein
MELTMDDLAENNLIKFTNISRKKDAIYANFKVKGIRRGVEFSASISVDISAAEMHPGETVENIVQNCAKIGIKEFKNADFEFEGVTAL